MPDPSLFPFELNSVTCDTALSVRYSLRPSNPIYGWWYFFMLFEAVPVQLGKVLPEFPPANEKDVDDLMDLRMCM